MPVEHRINLTAAEVRAYQAGERTLRRRVDLTKQGFDSKQPHENATWARQVPEGDWEWWGPINKEGRGLKYQWGVRSPFGSPGDVLVLRETFRVDSQPHGDDGHYGITYVADAAWGEVDYSEVNEGRITPGKSYRSTQMPRWAVRHTPTVVSSSVEQRDGVWWWVAVVDEGGVPR